MTLPLQYFINYNTIPTAIYLFKDFIYLFMRDTEKERGAEILAEGQAGSMRGAGCGTRSQVSRITPWAEGGAKLLSHVGCPLPTL